jgi:ribosomal protein S18 acetylase RimI-like enzyme
VETRAESGPARGDSRPGFVVRPARPEDAASFLDLWKEVVAERKYVRTDRVRRGVRYYRKSFRDSWTEDKASLVALHGERVIGQLEVQREESPVTRHVASLGMMVLIDWRSRGVGSALMTEAVRWGREAGVEKLALSVYPHNAVAKALYLKFGFQEEGRLSGHSKKAVGYLDEIVMGLWLVPRPDGSGLALEDPPGTR